MSVPSASAASPAPSAAGRVARLPATVAAFAAGAGPVVLLGFSRGGYPVEVVAGYGVVLTWVLLVGCLSGAIPRPRPTTTGKVVLVAIAGLAAWGLLSLTWTADRERGLTEAARILVAGGSLVLGMCAARSGRSRVLLGGVLAGLAVIVAASALSRLQPNLFADAGETSDFLGSATRTSWPLNYWNAVSAAGSIALALGIVLAVRARSRWTAAAAVAPMPVIALGMAFTLSRGGIFAAAVGLTAAVLLVSPRLIVLRVLLAPAAGAAVLVAAAFASAPIADATPSGAQTADGRVIIAVAILVIVGVALAQAGWSFADRARWTPRLPRPDRRQTTLVVGVATVFVVVGALASGVPGRAGDAWDEFRTPNVRQTGADRLTSASSNQRVQLWSGATDAMQSDPLRGIGLGSWESWWAARRSDTGFVRNAHSEPLELLAETGLIGAALFLVVLVGPLVAGIATVVRRRGPPDAVLAVPALLAFAAALCVDWNWQIGALMVAGMTIAAVPLTREGPDPPTSAARSTRRRGVRVARAAALPAAATAVALVSFATLAAALVAPQGVSDSRAAARAGDLAEAARFASAASGAADFTSSPALQLALIEQEAGDLDAAARAAAIATARSPDDWRGWFAAARIEVARGDPKAAATFYGRAQALSPSSDLLTPLP